MTGMKGVVDPIGSFKNDLKGIKNALKFLIESEMNGAIGSAKCDAVNSHSYKPGDRERAEERVRKCYEKVLKGLE
jgi:hypothetical protein